MEHEALDCDECGQHFTTSNFLARWWDTMIVCRPCAIDLCDDFDAATMKRTLHEGKVVWMTHTSRVWIGQG